jgi:DNA-directed RNA polymerase specialized sigma24 family protein
MKAVREALARLDAESLALLELCLRRGLEDEEIGEFLRVDPDEVAHRRDDLLERLAVDLQLDGREQRDELFATLPDLPWDYWRPQAARA